MRPAKVSPRVFVPDHIKKPDYGLSGVPAEEQMSRSSKIIEVKSAEDIERLRESCLLGIPY